MITARRTFIDKDLMNLLESRLPKGYRKSEYRWRDDVGVHFTWSGPQRIVDFYYPFKGAKPRIQVKDEYIKSGRWITFSQAFTTLQLDESIECLTKILKRTE